MIKKHVFQWHITHRCNLRCSHCYQNEYSSDLEYEQLLDILNQYIVFLKNKKYKGHINITGGEPFACKDLFKLLSEIEKNNITFGILTNGTYITDDICKKLSKYKNLSFVQISIDGNAYTHDQIRGKGNFEKVLKAFSKLNEYNIETMAAFTVHKKNCNEISEVIDIVKKHKIKRFWCDRLVPFDKDNDILSTSEFLDFTKVLLKEQSRALEEKSVTTIHLNRAMQFLIDEKLPIYHCSAGINLFAILANGDLYPCRRLPLKCGNVLEKTIDDIYNNSEIIQDLFFNNIPTECTNCNKKQYCKGGAKCLTYSIHSTTNKKDINCNI